MSCRACGNSNKWCSVYTGCPLNKGKEHNLKTEIRDWKSPKYETPPDGVVVNTMNSGGQVSQLKVMRGLWFVPDGSMYVYYTPTFWQTIEEA